MGRENVGRFVIPEDTERAGAHLLNNSYYRISLQHHFMKINQKWMKYIYCIFRRIFFASPLHFPPLWTLYSGIDDGCGLFRVFRLLVVSVNNGF